MKQYSILETDLYQISMGATYFQEGRHEDEVVFEGFVRTLPGRTNFLVFSGLQPLLRALCNWGVDKDEISYLSSLPQYATIPASFWEYLTTIKFTGEIYAPKEGTLLFEQEPFIKVKAPLIQAQLIETLVLSVLNYSMAVSTKASRVRLAAKDAKLMEFGFRRAPGPDAALMASRAAYIGGFDSTSNVMAGYEYGIPVAGTMAHSFILSHTSEQAAFESWNNLYGPKTSALIDTYDHLEGVRRAVAAFGPTLQGVRLDSGDKIVYSRNMRLLLDELGAFNTKIIVSDDMDEHKIRRNSLFEAPIDGYGVGTYVVNPGPLGGVYKLVEYGDRYTAKFSESKITYPGSKQIYRRYENGKMVKDDVDFFDLPSQSSGVPLLEHVMFEGNIIHTESLDDIKKRVYSELSKLPAKYLSLDDHYTYDVEFSDRIADEVQRLRRSN